MEQVASAGQMPAATTVILSDAVERFLRTYGEVGADGKYRGDAEYGLMEWQGLVRTVDRKDADYRR